MPNNGQTHAIDSLAALHAVDAALGAPEVSTNFTFVISSDGNKALDGIESLQFKTSAAPWVTAGVGEAIEYPALLGTKAAVPGTPPTKFQATLKFHETRKGAVHDFFTQIVNAGGVFDATIYNGTPEKHSSYRNYVNCFFTPEISDRDWDSATVLEINGQLTFHWFGGEKKGNSDNSAQLGYNKV